MTLPRLTQREVLAAGLFPLFFTSVPALQSLMDGVTTSKRLYFYAACALLFLVLSALLVFRKREITLEFNALDFALIALWLWALVRAAFTQYLVWHDDGVITITLLLFVYLVMRNVIAAEQRAGGTRVFSILAVGLMAGALLQSAYGMLQLYGLNPFPTNNYFKLIGSFGNPDALAGYLASIMPFALGMYLLIPAENAQLKHVRTMGLITFCATMLVLPATMIRGAWLGAGVGSLFIVWVKYDLTQRLRQLLSTRIRRFAATVLVLASVAGGGYGLYTLKPDSADGRLLIWKITLNMINDHPLWGIGFDRFAVEYGHYQAAYFASGNGTPREEYLAGNVHHAHNEVLQTVAELGLVGLVLLLVACRQVLSFFGHIGSMRPSISAGLLAGAVVCLFSFPMHVLPTSLNTMAALAFIASIGISAKPRATILYPAIALRLCAFLFTIGTVLLLRNITDKYVWYSWWQAAFHKTEQVDLTAAQEIYSRLHFGYQYDGKFLFMYGAVLSLLGLSENAVHLLEESKNHYTDPNLWVKLGDCYKELGNLEEAERNYFFAARLIPNRVNPKYLLVKLYLDQGRRAEALALANAILLDDHKESSATLRRIRKEMMHLKQASFD